MNQMIEIVLVGAIILLLYYYLRLNFDYWKKRCVAGPAPIPFFGNFKDTIFAKIHISSFVKNLYDAYPDEPVVGIFNSRTPVLMLRDPKLIEDVLILNYSNFSDHPFEFHEELLNKQMFFSNLTRWKQQRHKFPLSFAPENLQDMFPLLNQCKERFHNYLNKKVGDQGKELDCLKLSEKYATYVVGLCAFGLKMNGMSIMSYEDRVIRKVTRFMFEDSWTAKLKKLAIILPQCSTSLLDPIIIDSKVKDALVEMFKRTIEYRGKNNVRRNDFVDIMMDLRKSKERMEKKDMTIEFITTQTFVFFAAGFESSASTLAHALYELAQNPDIQEKLREEIKTTFDQNQSDVTYDVLRNMKYLDKVFKETLRKYPPLAAIPRVSLADHTFTDSNISINKGTSILIPVYGLHYDSKIFPDPDVFDPERFDENEIKSKNKMTYLPFSAGSRNCIGEHFTQMQTQLGLAMIIRHFKFEVCEKTCIPYVKNKQALLISPEDGKHLKIEKI